MFYHPHHSIRSFVMHIIPPENVISIQINSVLIGIVDSKESNDYCIYPCTSTVDPVYNSTPTLEPKKCFSYSSVRIFLKNLSFILEFSLRNTMVTRKICPEFFFLSVFDPCIS